MSLHEYIENEILPRYAAFDKGHQRDHAESVIEESMVLAQEHGADKEMAYVIAAFHDLGLEKDRELHHIYSGEILMADPILPQFFNKEQLMLMREAVEDHRASSKSAPRSIYGAIVAEADRHIDPETILRRTMQFGLKQNPEIRIGEVVQHDGYTTQNYALETLPGLYTCRTIYAPTTKLKRGAKRPLIISPAGHWPEARYRADQQYRMATFARMGAVAVDIDIVA